MALFPGALPAAGSATSTDTLKVAGHTGIHNTDRDEIRAVASKVGTGASTPAANQVLTGDGVGTSSWAQVDLTSMITGTLPVNKGGTNATSESGARDSLDVYSTTEVDTEIDDAIDAAKQALYPVGSIYIETTGTNPNTTFGFGTWEAFGEGKVLVGLDSADSDFDAAEKTGGAKTHSHPISGANAQAHITMGGSPANIRMNRVSISGSNWSSSHKADLSGFAASSASQGSGSPVNGDTDSADGMNPYIVVYMWKRTA